MITLKITLVIRKKNTGTKEELVHTRESIAVDYAKV